MRIPSAVASGLCALVIARVVTAAPRREPVTRGRRTDADPIASLAVAGPRGCVTRAEVMTRVARRSQRIRFVGDPGGAGPALHVDIDAGRAGAVTATLAFVWPAGARSERRLTARTCPEAADAVALVIALALDPGATGEPVPAAPVAPAAPAEAVNAPAAGTADSAARSPRSSMPGRAPESGSNPLDTSAREVSGSQESSKIIAPPPSAPSRSAEAMPSASVSPSASAPSSASGRPGPTPAVTRLGVGAAARAIRGPAPRLMPGFALAFDWRLDRDSPWTWAVQLVAATYAQVTWATPGGAARFDLDAVTLHVCPLRLGVRGAGVRLCGSSTLGRLSARGGDTFSPRSSVRSIASAGGAALIAVTPHPHVALTASVEPTAALVRDRFSFDPEVFHGVPRLILTFGVGVAVTFP